MQIVVKLLDGTSLNLEVDPQDTAATVKQKIADKSLDGGSKAAFPSIIRG